MGWRKKCQVSFRLIYRFDNYTRAPAQDRKCYGREAGDDNNTQLKMKILYVSIILLLSVQAKKEQLSRLQDIFNDPEIMRIVKKLGLSEEDLTPPKENNIDKSASETLPDRPTPELPVRPTTAQPEHVTDSVGNSCFYTSHESTIIRSKESTQAGSHFLRSDKYRTRYDCIKSCCYTQGCTLAVFENKV